MKHIVGIIICVAIINCVLIYYINDDFLKLEMGIKKIESDMKKIDSMLDTVADNFNSCPVLEIDPDEDEQYYQYLMKKRGSDGREKEELWADIQGDSGE